jgi:hypothetical protein
VQKRQRVVVVIVGALLSLMAAPPMGYAADCSANHCYARIDSAIFPRPAYQVSAWESWTCQSLADSRTIAAATMWAHHVPRVDGFGLNWVEAGVTSGPMAGSWATFNRDWYVARNVDNASESFYQEFMPIIFRPSRSTSYVVTIRRSAGLWQVLLGGNQILQLSTPAVTLTGAGTGGEVEDARDAETGASTHLSVTYAADATPAAWPLPFPHIDEPYTPASVPWSASSIVHSIPSPRVACS